MQAAHYLALSTPCVFQHKGKPQQQLLLFTDEWPTPHTPHTHNTRIYPNYVTAKLRQPR